MKKLSDLGQGLAVLAALLLILALVCQPAQAAPASTIQSLIDAAADGGTVNIPAGTFTESLSIHKNITLAGPGTGTAILQPAAGQRIITVSDGNNLTLQNLTFTGASISDVGGAVYLINADLSVDACTFYNNHASFGGAIFQDQTGSVTITNSSLHDNVATWDGGAVYARGNVELIGVTLSLNLAGRHGGGLSIENDLTAQGGQISNNTADNNQDGDGNGGGINVNNNLTLNGVTIDHNVTGAQGGGVNQWNASNDVLVTITDTTFNANQALLKGGGLNVAQGAETMISKSTFTGNIADSKSTKDTYGGGINFKGTQPNHSITVTESTFKNNKTGCTGDGCTYHAGGGLYAEPLTGGKVILTDDWFENNYAWGGGGIEAKNADILHTTFKLNTGGYGAGAGLFGNATVHDSAFLQNKAMNQGGGLISSGPSFAIYHTLFSENSGGLSGGGTLWMSNATTGFMQNVAVINTQVANGSAILLQNNPGTLDIYHLTLNGVTASAGSPKPVGIALVNSANVNLYNSIIANLSAAQGIGVQSDDKSNVVLDHTLWYDNTTPTAKTGATGSLTNLNPLSGNPVFGADGYHITKTSAAIDKGSPTSVTIDMDGDQRDTKPEIGADEYRVKVFIPLTVR